MKIRLPIPLNPHYGYMKSEETTQIIEYLKNDIEMTEELVRIIQEGKSLYPHTIFIKSGYNRKEQQMKALGNVQVLKERARMCNSITICRECPINKKADFLGLEEVDGICECNNFFINNPNEAFAVIQKWSATQPEKTFLSDFLEKYPKAPLEEDNGTPRTVCPYHLGYEEHNDRPCRYNSQNCLECWYRPLEG